GMPRGASRMRPERAGSRGGDTCTRRHRMTQPEGQTARDVFPEDEGIPEISQDDFPTTRESEDPQFAPVPGDDPRTASSLDFGTTAYEQSEGESLTGRLEREI